MGEFYKKGGEVWGGFSCRFLSARGFHMVCGVTFLGAGSLANPPAVRQGVVLGVAQDSPGARVVSS